MKVNVTIPVFNEEVRLARSLPVLHRFLTEHGRFEWQIVIADNASTDRTHDLAQQLAGEYPNVRVVWLPRKGRGGALKKVWSESNAAILSYVDVDLSTDLYDFPPLIEALVGGGFEVAIGSRLLKHSLTQRNWRREFISRCYNRLIKVMLHTRFSDAQCGFKAITGDAARKLLPLVKDDGWFFDTELLILAERIGYRIFEVPVQWTDDPDTRVKVLETAWKDLLGLWRVRRGLIARRDGVPVSRAPASPAAPSAPEPPVR